MIIALAYLVAVVVLVAAIRSARKRAERNYQTFLDLRERSRDH